MSLTSRPISGRSSIGGRAFSVMCAVSTPVSDDESNGFCADEHLVQHHAHRIDVAARIELLALHLLGTHVVRRPDDQPRLRHPLMRLGHARDAEVHQLDLALVIDEDVLRLDVAVDDALLVRRLAVPRQIWRAMPMPTRGTIWCAGASSSSSASV